MAHQTLARAARVTGGTPTGGQFARTGHAEADGVELAAPADPSPGSAAPAIFTAAAADIITAYDQKARADLLASLQGRQVYDDGQHRTTVGSKYQGWRPAADIARAVRADIKQAQQARALPDGVSYQVRSESFAGGQAVRITAMGVPDSALLRTDVDGQPLRRPTEEANALSDTLTAMGTAYDRAMAGTDLYNPTYFCSVTIESEHSREFREYEKVMKPIQSAWRSDGAGVPDFSRTVHGMESRRGLMRSRSPSSHTAPHIRNPTSATDRSAPRGPRNRVAPWPVRQPVPP